MPDIVMAPWFDRMCVLEHYKNFIVPQTKPFERWFIWQKAVLEHPAVKPTREPKEKLIAHYQKYFKRTARDKYYDKYYKNFTADKFELWRYKPYNPAHLDNKGIDYVNEHDKWGMSSGDSDDDQNEQNEEKK